MWTVDTYEDLHMRLNGTAGLYDGVAVMIEVRRQPAGSDVNVVTINSIRDGGRSISKIISSQDPKLNVNKFNNGFMNCNLGRQDSPYTIFLRRAPLRQQRQAFSLRVCSGFGIYGTGIVPNAPVSDYDIAGNVGLCDLLEDSYPQWKQVRAKVSGLRNEKAAMAFSRDWALQTGEMGALNLWYQTTCVGYFSDKKSLAVINSDISGLSFVITDLDRLGIPYTVV